MDAITRLNPNPNPDAKPLNPKSLNPNRISQPDLFSRDVDGHCRQPGGTQLHHAPGAVRVLRQKPTLSRIPLDPTHVRLKLLHAFDQWHSSRKFTPLTGSHCKLRPNAEGSSDGPAPWRPVLLQGGIRLRQDFCG
jgi:hypothetical protein